MEQHTFSDFVQSLSVELRKVAYSGMTTLRGESFFKKHAVSGCKTIANEKTDNAWVELWPMEDKELKHEHNHSQ